MFLVGPLRARSVSSFCDFRKITFRDLTAFSPFWIEQILCFSYIFILIKEQCCVRVQVVKSESQSESSPLSPSPSPSHHLKVRVRVITSESESESASPSQKQKNWVNIVYLPKHENKQQNVSNVRVNSATRHGRYCLDSGVTRARVTSHDFWVRVRVRVKVKKTGLESESE